MILLNMLQCKIKGHDFIPAGNCPVTGLTYVYCKRCAAIIGKEVIK